MLHDFAAAAARLLPYQACARARDQGQADAAFTLLTATQGSATIV
jgi:hypothetical protein